MSGKFGRLACLLTLGLGACAAGEPPQVLSASPGLRCVDDSPACVAQRQSTLKAMVGDPSRGWIKDRPDAAAYASGVRLFAYKNKKKELTCPELQAGRQEADGASAALRATGTGLTPAQISRGVMLAGEVGRELGNEYQRRCRKT